ncbi:NADP-dependent oxidoreductase [Rhodococcus sp. MSC1_016]|jgi:NADPH-dependent curcumin reductase CurA|uniref:NADP-dependent oxidoreductase n=1 Tax=Rhodococcus sp. MSC1_016 TaxID=2909266 RepID=UPI00202F1B67|nr:NADP-dependent oxidoreductase [Rhodococcus sp. MSC1_016]
MNRQFRLAHRPVGAAKETDWDLVTELVPSPGDGEFVVQIQQLSLDPAMRGWMNAGRSYVPPVEVGAVMRAYATGTVVVSRHPDFPVGELVTGEFGVQEYALSDGRGVRRIDRQLPVSASAYLGVLGLTGLTAYFGLLDVGQFQPGQTVVVTGAAGAVGSTVGQLAKLQGGRVVGIAGGAEKCHYLVHELGFDAAIDYKSENIRQALRTHAPYGADVFFDNVGGDILNDGLLRLAQRARVVLCGAVSQYNSTTGAQGPDNYLALLIARARMEGFVVTDYEDRYDEAIEALARWITDGALIAAEDIIRDSILAFPKTLARLFAGENTGKLILELEGAA